jgi:hypothetical protein
MTLEQAQLKVIEYIRSRRLYTDEAARAAGATIATLEALGLISFEDRRTSCRAPGGVCGKDRPYCDMTGRCQHEQADLNDCQGERSKFFNDMGIDIQAEPELRSKLHGKSIYTHTSGRADFMETVLNSEMIDGFADLVARAGYQIVKKPPPLPRHESEGGTLKSLHAKNHITNEWVLISTDSLIQQLAAHDYQIVKVKP